MAETLEQLADDIRTILKADPGAGGKQKICHRVALALRDDAFIATHLKDRAPGAHPREILHEDPELGFCICGHVYASADHGKPHDHGSSWAIYGQATGATEMTDWKIVEQGRGEQPSLVEPVQTYTLRRGDVHFYDVGAVHSPSRSQPVKLIRIEGSNLDHVERSKIRAK